MNDKNMVSQMVDLRFKPGKLKPTKINRAKFIFVIFIFAAFLFVFHFVVKDAAGAKAWTKAQGKGQEPSAQWILEKVDENILSGNKVVTARMVIHGRRGSRSLEFKSYLQGEEKGFTEFLAPARERGTKMLKLGDQLWTYSPSSDRIILISGHMLRQSVMGSDLSYEDMMEDRRLVKIYDASIAGEEKIMEADCWVLELKAKTPDVAYAARKIWVDKEKFIVWKEERFARSGALLKTTEVKKIGQFQRRWVPVQAVYKDVLKAGEGTEFIIDAIEFDAQIPESIFTKASLK